MRPAQRVDRLVEFRGVDAPPGHPFQRPMVTSACCLRPGIWMKVATDAFGLEAQRVQGIPERPVDQLQPGELGGWKDTCLAPRRVQQRHQRRVRPGVTVGDGAGCRGCPARLTDHGVHLPEAFHRQR